MSGTYNPTWKGDLTRGYWDCGHWYDFPTEGPVSMAEMTQLLKNATAKPETLAEVTRRHGKYLSVVRDIAERIGSKAISYGEYALLSEAHKANRITADDLKWLERDIPERIQKMLLDLSRQEYEEKLKANYEQAMADVAQENVYVSPFPTRQGMSRTVVIPSVLSTIGTSTMPASAAQRLLTINDIRAVADKLRAAGLRPIETHVDAAFYDNTGLRLYWNKSLPRHGVTLILRTIGGVPVIGQWQGEYGQFFNAWAELPQDEPIQPEMKGSENDYL